MEVNGIQFFNYKNNQLRKFFAPCRWERCLSFLWDQKILFKWLTQVENDVNNSPITKSNYIQMAGNMCDIICSKNKTACNITVKPGGLWIFLPLIIRYKGLEIRDNYLFLALLPLLKGKEWYVLSS
jgi:hypothetical protein